MARGGDENQARESDAQQTAALRVYLGFGHALRAVRGTTHTCAGARRAEAARGRGAGRRAPTAAWRPRGAWAVREGQCAVVVGRGLEEGEEGRISYGSPRARRARAKARRAALYTGFLFRCGCLRCASDGVLDAPIVDAAAEALLGFSPRAWRPRTAPVAGASRAPQAYPHGRARQWSQG